MEFRLQGVRRARLGRGWCPGLGEIQTPLGLKTAGVRLRERGSEGLTNALGTQTAPEEHQRLRGLRREK